MLKRMKQDLLQGGSLYYRRTTWRTIVDLKSCHEVVFYFLMKPRGTKELNSNSYTGGFKENMYWIPVDELDQHVAYPTFMKEYLAKMPKEIVHIVTNERE